MAHLIVIDVQNQLHMETPVFWMKLHMIPKPKNIPHTHERNNNNNIDDFVETFIATVLNEIKPNSAFKLYLRYKFMYLPKILNLQHTMVFYEDNVFPIVEPPSVRADNVLQFKCTFLQ